MAGLFLSMRLRRCRYMLKIVWVNVDWPASLLDVGKPAESNLQVC
ncbi:MAG: hypothetical protein RLZZ172_2682, partial [Bacteroidota bacterium]